MTHVTVVVGAQFGSEGKGAICAHLGKDMGSNDVAVRVAGPNAGHTAYDSDGVEWKLRAVPVAAVTSPDCRLHIAAGSEIDPGVLDREIRQLQNAGHNVTDRLTIHPSATILTDRHQSVERESGLVGAIGSTGKGIGAARADRIMRQAATARAIPYLEPHMQVPDFSLFQNVVVEGTQGYGLGLHTEYYPQVTSSDCRAIDFLAMAGISPWSLDITSFHVRLVARVYPIRVAGNSGPLNDETTWADLGLPEEHTTVTHKVRRVGKWDEGLVKQAIKANGGGSYHPQVTLALTMLDQMYPEIRDQTKLTDPALAFVEDIEDDLETSIELVGTGPQTVVEL